VCSSGVGRAISEVEKSSGLDAAFIAVFALGLVEIRCVKLSDSAKSLH
jgi:hypothetical protein